MAGLPRTYGHSSVPGHINWNLRSSSQSSDIETHLSEHLSGIVTLQIISIAGDEVSRLLEHLSKVSAGRWPLLRLLHVHLPSTVDELLRSNVEKFMRAQDIHGDIRPQIEEATIGSCGLNVVIGRGGNCLIARSI